jgi:nucleoside-diphosphate-sugar epimerase
LFDKYKKSSFPVTIIRPGNVFGPGATVWVHRIIKSIQEHRIALIDGGKGIFFHTYIDNLLDAVLLTINNPETFGERIDITDGDNSITWKQYFHDLSKIIDEIPPQKNLSKNQALIIGYLMILRYTVTLKEPWVTPTAIHSMTSHSEVSIMNAKKLINYRPKIQYEEAIEKIKEWWKNKN